MNFTKETLEKGAELQKKLTQKAWESSTFKEQLVKNPVQTIEQVTGKSLKDFDKKVIVEDQTDISTIYFNIPKQEVVDDLMLNEEQLEQIAGGITPVAYVAGAAIGYGICMLIDEID